MQIETTVDEYGEGFPVYLIKIDGEYSFNHRVPVEDWSDERWVIRATNEGGYNCTEVDLEQLLLWVYKNNRELYEKCLKEAE